MDNENENKIIELQNAPAVSNGGGIVSIKPVQSVDDVLELTKQIQDFTAKVLKQDEDFGVIPGCGTKPSLLKPGAEKLCQFFGLGHRTAKIEKTENFDKESFFFAYDYTVEVYSLRQPEVVIADSTGHANSQETKWAERAVWDNGKRVGVRDATYREVCGQVNIIKKIAEKRAMVSAVIKATRASHKFTQDIEDMDKSLFDKGQPKQTKAHDPLAMGKSVIKYGEFKGKTLDSLERHELHNYVIKLKGDYRQKVIEFGIAKFPEQQQPKPKDVTETAKPDTGLNDFDGLDQAIQQAEQDKANE